MTTCSRLCVKEPTKINRERGAGISRIAATVIAIMGVMSVFIFAACETKEKSRAPTAAPTPVETPSPDQIITVGDISNNPGKKIRRFQPLANYMSKHLKDYGIESGKVVIVRDVEEMARLLKDGTVDIYLDSPFPALAVQDLSASEFILRRWKKGDATFWSTFVALRASGITSTEDFVGKVVVFKKPDSTGGFALPAGTLIRRGYILTEVNSPDEKVVPDEIGYVFSGGNKNTIEIILQGQVAGGGLSNPNYEELPSELKQQIVAFDRTLAVPRQLVSVRPGLDPGMVRKIRELLIGLDQTEEGQQILIGMRRTKKFDALSSDSDTSLRELKELMSLIAVR